MQKNRPQVEKQPRPGPPIYNNNGQTPNNYQWTDTPDKYQTWSDPPKKTKTTMVRPQTEKQP